MEVVRVWRGVASSMCGLCVAALTACSLPAVARARAAVVTAASCSQQDVQSAVDQAGDGDTVLVPAGGATWRTTDTNYPAAIASRKGSEKSIALKGSRARLRLLSKTWLSKPLPRHNQWRRLWGRTRCQRSGH